MKSELIFVPFPGIGHVKSAVEMAKLLVQQENSLTVSILILPSLSRNEVGASAYVAALSAESNDTLRYEVISGGDNKPTKEPTMPGMHIEIQMPNVRRAVAKLVDGYSKPPDSPRRLAGLVVDMFCISIIEVAKEFRVPSYLFFTSGAGMLSLGFHVQALCDQNKYDVRESDFQDTEAELIVPSLTRPFPVKCLPHGLVSEKKLEMLNGFSRKFREMKGILVNTVAELETTALAFLSSGETPPAYPVGPLLHLDNHDEKKQAEILEWLDKQPARSVVFLCFGSMGGFGEEQVREIAVALDRSGHRFIWCLRRSTPDTIKESPGEFTNLEGTLPDGFLDRTAERGKVIGWAPQVAVLAKPAIGGFVTHCGWNSMLESLWFGVPTAAWPLYAEQKFNAFDMVEELGLAVEIKKYWRCDHLGDTAADLVKAEELERAIKCLMEQDSEVRKRVKEMSDKCHVALTDGGSSRVALQKFIQDVKKNIS